MAPLIEQLRLLSGVVGQVLARRANLKALQHASDEVDQLRALLTERSRGGAPDVTPFRPSSARDQLQAENLFLRREAGSGSVRASSSEKVQPFAECSNRCGRSRPPIRRCCCSARPAPARSSSRRTFTN